MKVCTFFFSHINLASRHLCYISFHMNTNWCVSYNVYELPEIDVFQVYWNDWFGLIYLLFLVFFYYGSLIWDVTDIDSNYSTRIGHQFLVNIRKWCQNSKIFWRGISISINIFTSLYDKTYIFVYFSCYSIHVKSISWNVPIL